MVTKNTKKILSGSRVALAGSTERVDMALNVLLSEGAEVINLPLSMNNLEGNEIMNEILSALGEYDWFIFTSALGVEGFFTQFFSRFQDLRYLGPCRIACIGKGTREAVESYRLEVNCVPEEHSEDALLKALLELEDMDNRKICIVSGKSQAESKISSGLTEQGRAIVDAFPITEGLEKNINDAELVLEFREKGADFIVFFDECSVDSFIAQAGMLRLGKKAIQPKVISFNSTVTKALKQKGIPVFKELNSETIEELVSIIEK